jgi:hypothetical protein
MRSTAQSLSIPTLLAAAMASALLLSGCATLFSGSSQEVEIQSEPSEAEIMVEGTKRAETPATIEVTRPEQGDPPEITINKEGYEERSLQLNKSFNGITLLNILNPFNYALGVPVLGFGVDWFTGALWKYEPEGYTVELESGGASSSLAPTPSKATYATPSTVERYRLQSLPTDENGRYVVPAHDHAVSVYDSDTGTIYRFH